MRTSTNRSGGLAKKRCANLGIAAAITLVAVTAALLTGCGQASQSSSSASSAASSSADASASSAANSSASTTAAIPDGAIEWSEASSHIGETVSVYGPVKGSSFTSGSKGQNTYVDIGAEYPDEHRVSMDIRGENRSNFPGDPENIYLNKTVCVTGEIYEHDGVAYIRVASADQVKVLD